MADDNVNDQEIPQNNAQNNAPARVPRTHINPEVIQALKDLPLYNKLEKNRSIKTANNAREMTRVNHLIDPVAYPRNGLDQASLITLDQEETPSSIRPSHVHCYYQMGVRHPESDGRQCMDGSIHTARVIGVPATIIFLQSLFDTENCVLIPLPFFLHKNLRYITDNAATLPTVNSNPLAGKTKGISIINVQKLSATLGKEGSLTCSQWTEAAY
ncbi:hypothetical protein B0H34DRAFT_784721 [Crassisporium funariophilum]|nr:hypothetical protein B0H34DRAFT_784721 [Crassisporium funariophilum]